MYIDFTGFLTGIASSAVFSVISAVWKQACSTPGNSKPVPVRYSRNRICRRFFICLLSLCLFLALWFYIRGQSFLATVGRCVCGVLSFISFFFTWGVFDEALAYQPTDPLAKEIPKNDAENNREDS